MRFPRTMPISERLNFHTEPIPECGCWIWMGRLNHDGYGMLDVGYKSYGAHRLSWSVHRGKIPSGISVLHQCDTPACINPDHLFLGTQLDNIKDRTQKKRGKNPRYAGSTHPMAKLTEADVAAIRASTANQYALAAAYGVTQSAISNIKTGRNWK